MRNSAETERGALPDMPIRQISRWRNCLRIARVSSTPFCPGMEPFYIEIHPDEEADAEKPLSSHEGEEFIVVVTGELEVLLGPDRHILGPGDSIYYNSVVPHYVGCGNAPQASIYAVLYFPQ